MNGKKYLNPGICFLMTLLAVMVSTPSASAKSYVYDSGEKSYVVDGQSGAGRGAGAQIKQKSYAMSAAWREKAEVFLRQGNVEQAIKAASIAINYVPTLMESYLLRAKAYTAAENYSAASQDLKRVLKRDPASGEAYGGLGLLAEKTGSLGEARKYYQKGCDNGYGPACDGMARLGQGLAGTPEQDLARAVTREELERFIDQQKPDELAFVAVQRLAQPYIKVRDWNGAMAVYQRYQKEFPGMQDRFSKIIALLYAPAERLEVRNVGGEVNTNQGEYNPVISIDGSKLYFGRDRGVGDGGEEIYVAEWHDQQWGHVTKMGAPIATETHEVPLAVSADGNTLALFGNYAESYGRGDIFYADRTSTCWTNIKHYPSPINSEHFDSNAMYTADGKSILFVSERPGGVGEFQPKDELFHGSYGGNTDIYVYTQNPSGQFEVINLGETINTPYSEYSPYLHPDGKTLYFSSDGHYGLGGLDVFVSYRKDENSWTEWTTPVNLGKEINGPNNDWGYQVDTSGAWAYFSVADRLDGFGANDIYMSRLPSHALPKAVTTISGRVTDPAGNIVNDVQIRWNDIALQKEAGEAKSDPQSGNYFIALPAGRLYGYYAEKPGYMGRSEEVDLRDKATFAQYTVDIMMYPVDEILTQVPTSSVAHGIRLNNVFFDFDKSDLKPESSLELDRWVAFLTEYGDIVARIHGHTDNTGSDAYNMDLSNRRAASVVNYLVGKGISRDRLLSKGFGERKPVASNDSEEGQRLNRRVEIHFNGASDVTPPAESEARPAPVAAVPQAAPQVAAPGVEAEEPQVNADEATPLAVEPQEPAEVDALVAAAPVEEPPPAEPAVEEPAAEPAGATPAPVAQ